MEKILSLAALWENITDLLIIFLQTYCFFIKMSDADTFNINPE